MHHYSLESILSRPGGQGRFAVITSSDNKVCSMIELVLCFHFPLLCLVARRDHLLTEADIQLKLLCVGFQVVNHLRTRWVPCVFFGKGEERKSGILFVSMQMK